jgi:surface protein
MNKLNKIKSLLEKNHSFKGINYIYFPKTCDELIELIESLINQYGNKVNLNIIDVSDIEDFGSIFWREFNFNRDVSEWDVSSGKIFNSMFYGCYKFNGDISNWDVSNAKNLSFMFFECKKFTVNLSNWDVSNCKDFSWMFAHCKSFNADLSKWNVKKAKNVINFVKGSLLEKYPERIPEKFRDDYL